MELIKEHTLSAEQYMNFFSRIQTYTIFFFQIELRYEK